MPRVKVAYRSNSREVYNRFCKAHPSIKLSFEKWQEIIYTFNYNFRDHILETGDKCKLPWGLGVFSIQKKKAKKYVVVEGKEFTVLPIDWVKSRKLGKHVYNFNTHTDGYRYKWKWFREECRLYISDVWVFKPSRTTSRKLAEYLKRPNCHYAQLYREWDRK